MAARWSGVNPMADLSERPDPSSAGVGLYWIPLGAGTPVVRFSGIVYEALVATLRRRSRCDPYHSVLEIAAPSGRYTVEMTPVPDAHGEQRGVVAVGPVGTRLAGRSRLFRYEIRRWRDGVVPDLVHAVDSPVVVTTEPARARAILELVSAVPTPTWGRDELHAGEMWSCNSVTSWILTAAGVDVAAISFPPHAHAPGWDAGIVMARRSLACRRAPTAPSG
jgi:hypothetical protein